MDYTSESGTLRFAPGETEKRILLSAIDDADDEGNETFYVDLQNPSEGATIVDGQGEVTIQDNDSPVVTMYVSDLDASAESRPRGKWDAIVTITVMDANGSPVVGASVTGDWSNGELGSATTDGLGQAVITLSNINKNTSSITFTVTGVALTGWMYDPALNQDDDDPADSDGTVIEVLKP